jgi:phosphopantetheine adenylyltransferase/dephospho-CoA kinase
MFIIALTGGICCGKTSVTEICRNLGAYIIDADKLGHKAYQKGTKCYQNLLEAFGEEILTEEKEINRKTLGSIVFSNRRELQRLNEIVWPRIREMIEMELEQIKNEDNNQIVLLEAAIFIEAGWHDLVDEIWVVETEQ